MAGAPAPVSYTHLATIGRWKAPTLKKWFNSGCFSNLESFDGSGIDVSSTTDISYIFQNRTKLKELNLRGWSIKPSVKTVSYTHLDVYKRQPLSRALISGM